MPQHWTQETPPHSKNSTCMRAPRASSACASARRCRSPLPARDGPAGGPGGGAAGLNTHTATPPLAFFPPPQDESFSSPQRFLARALQSVPLLDAAHLPTDHSHSHMPRVPPRPIQAASGLSHTRWQDLGLEVLSFTHHTGCRADSPVCLPLCRCLQELGGAWGALRLLSSGRASGALPGLRGYIGTGEGEGKGSIARAAERPTFLFLWVRGWESSSCRSGDARRDARGQS